jgi:ribonuclease P protein component
MLPLQHRLAKTTEIAAVQTRGRRFFNQFLVLKVGKPTTGTARFAFIVSTKVSKKAVERNRIRRVLREAIRPILPNLKPGDYVLIAKNQITALDNQALSEQCTDFLKKLKLSI